MESGCGSRGGGKAHVVAVDPVQGNKLKRRERETMRGSWGGAWSRKRAEDNHVRLVGGREEDAAVGALVIFQKIASREEGVGRRRWRKRTSWHCFLVLGDLRRAFEKQEEDGNSEQEKQESKSSNNCSHDGLHRGGGSRKWLQKG